jgi:hypothetical protein
MTILAVARRLLDAHMFDIEQLRGSCVEMVTGKSKKTEVQEEANRVAKIFIGGVSGGWPRKGSIPSPNTYLQIGHWRTAYGNR